MALDPNIKIHKSKDELFKNEQHQVLARLFDILKINVDDSTSYLDRNELQDKEDKIMELYDDIIKYYLSSMWRNINSATSNKFMSIIRCLLKHHGYILTFKNAQVKKINESGQEIKIVMQRYFIKTK